MRRIAQGLLPLAVPLMTLLAACSGGPSGSTGPIAHPSGNEVVLRIEYSGGFVAPAFRFTSFPSFTLAGDGRVIVPGPQIERLVRCGNPPAFLEKGVGKLIEAGQPVGRDQPLGGEEARVEIMAALSLGQRARRVGQDVLGRHGANFP